VALTPVTSLNQTSVILNGSVSSNLSATSWHFEYGLTDAYGKFSPGLDGIVPEDSSAAVSATVVDLEPNTIYHYRLHASNGAGIVNTVDGAFTTSGPVSTVTAPGVSQNAASSITSSGATLSGTVTPNGAETSWHFVVSRQSGSTPTLDHGIEDTDIGVVNDTVEYTGASWTHCAGCAPLTPDNSFYYGYTAGQTYTVRFNGTRLVIYAPNDLNGAAAAAVTVDGVPEGTANFFAAAEPRSNGIRYDTGVLAAGNHTVVVTVPTSTAKVCLFEHADVYIGSGTTTETFIVPVPDGIVPNGAPQAVNTVLTGLQANTQYTYELTASNSAGTNDTADLNFTTSAAATAAPGVTINSATNITGSSGTVSGTVTPNGSDTTWQFEIGIDTSYGGLWPFFGAVVVSGPTTDVSQVITGLVADTTYHYRLKAVNAGGTTYSSDMSFHTNLGTPIGTFWPFGGSANNNTESATDQWQANMSLGRPCTVCLCYNNRNGTGMWDLGQGQTSAYSNRNHQLLLQTPPFPNLAGYNYTNLINGNYDAQWRSYAQQMKNREDAGFPPIIVCLAWEMNGTYFYWGGPGASRGFSNSAQYVAGYRRIVNAMRSVYPNVLTAFAINGHNSNPQTNSDELYPGDSYVTYRGGDWYNHFDGNPRIVGSSSDRSLFSPIWQRFNAEATGPDGILWMLDRVKAGAPDAVGRPKKLIVPEWGIDATGTSPDGDGTHGGDHPDWIEWTFRVYQYAFSTGHMGPETYFNERIGSGFDILGTHPASRARYQSLYRP
jgi:hypothetical protein